ncbi:hypothetical protein [Anaerosinus massiliensis]|uniref:hypothetical protein n=1 Tax=Massilibacillus massiliensis TaxID=1806837 RepID=UPI000DA60A90|nr:hypothetical protein [Massilibacillus massiliensis]
MQNSIKILVCSTLLMSSMPAAWAGADLGKGETLLEIGSSLNSKVKGEGALPLEAGGESGFKSAITYAIDDNLSIQYRKNMFTSEEKTVSLGGYNLTTQANADLSDYNLLYKLNKNAKLIVGYEHNKITYDDYVTKATRSGMHIGLNTTYPLSQKTALFTNHIYGNKMRSNEIGFNIDLDKKSALAISYIDRRVNDMDVKIPAVNYTNKIDYKMTGIAVMYGIKL